MIMPGAASKLAINVCVSIISSWSRAASKPPNVLPFSSGGAAEPAPRFYTMSCGATICCNGLLDGRAPAIAAPSPGRVQVLPDILGSRLRKLKPNREVSE
jgi:hypothetical protein